MKASLIAYGLGLAWAILAHGALAAGDGTAVAVDPDAQAQAGSATRILAMGSDISVGELVVTGPRGQVQIVFNDQTRLVVGPGSSLKIEAYLMANGNTAQKLAINALGGSFRFITGNSPKPAYSIRTPNAAIAVRGTKFDIIVGANETAVMLYEGALQICATGGDCKDVTNRCEVGTASSQRALVFPWASADHQSLSVQFRYARFQKPLLPDFRVTGTARCAEEKSGDDPTSLSTTSGDGVVPKTPPQVTGNGPRPTVP